MSDAQEILALKSRVDALEGKEDKRSGAQAILRYLFPLLISAISVAVAILK